MKKKIIFVIESLNLGGGSERSLLSLLKYIDEEKYEIDLQTIYQGGELESLVPKYVNILPPLRYTTFTKKSYVTNILQLNSLKNIKSLIAKLCYSIKIRRRKSIPSERAQFFWECAGNVINSSEKNYDVAIAFAQNLPTFYVIEKTQALKKVAWVNVTMNFPLENNLFHHKFYQSFDNIVAITDDVSKHHQSFFPDLVDKFRTINNIIDYESIIEMADLEVVNFKNGDFNLLTVARFSNQKGYDILLEACKILKEKGLDFHWYVIGGGYLENEIVTFIEENLLQDKITLLGLKENPYPYFKAADLYVHTAKHEGFGRTLAEARLLNIPVVTTRFDTVFMQMVDGKNGLVTDMNAEAVADAIEQMMTNRELYNSIEDYLKHEEKENYESVKKFDGLIEELLDSN